MSRQFRTLVQGPFLENSWNGFVSNLLLFHCYEASKEHEGLAIKCLASPSKVLIPDSVGKTMELIFGESLLRVSSNVETLAAQFEGQLVCDSWSIAASVLGSHWVSGVIGLDVNPGLYNCLSDCAYKFHVDHWSVSQVLSWSINELAKRVDKDGEGYKLHHNLDNSVFIFPPRLDGVVPEHCKAWAKAVKDSGVNRVILYFPAPYSSVATMAETIGQALAAEGVDVQGDEFAVDVVVDPLPVENIAALIRYCKLNLLPCRADTLLATPEEAPVNFVETLAETYWRSN